MKFFYSCIRALVKGIFSSLYGLKVYGLEHLTPGGAIIAPNHSSYLDPPVIAASWPEEAHFLARKSLFKHFLLRSLITHLNAYPIAGNAQDLSSVKLICRLLSENKKVVIFPEGLRTWDGQVSPIKSGIGMLALRSNSAIIPAYIDGCYEIWNRNRRFPKFYGKIICVFGSPIEPKSYIHLDRKTAQEKMAEDTKTAIDKLKRWMQNGASGIPP